MPTARIRTLARALESGGQSTLAYGALVVDLRSRRVTIAGRRARLSPMRFGLLVVLASHRGRVVSKEALGRMLGESTPLSANAIEEHVSRLRREIAPAGITIVTLRGRGYCLEPRMKTGPAPLER